jgi:anthranilate synthase/aminodeoxychorismate synthase-like glutamine amidotransferase
MIVVIDNYDSFTFNLVQYLGEITHQHVAIRVYRNNMLSVDEVMALDPSHLVISPGPCTPNEAGISVELVRRASGEIPILGVCLGHQAIIQAFGGKIVRAAAPMHGKVSAIAHCGSSVFEGLPNPLRVTRYHSLVGHRETLPADLEILAETTDAASEIMAVRSRTHSTTVGVQFHPEAILTEGGKQLLRTFLNLSSSLNVPSVTLEQHSARQ